MPFTNDLWYFSLLTDEWCWQGNSETIGPLSGTSHVYDPIGRTAFIFGGFMCKYFTNSSSVIGLTILNSGRKSNR